MCVEKREGRRWRGERRKEGWELEKVGRRWGKREGGRKGGMDGWACVYIRVVWCVLFAIEYLYRSDQRTRVQRIIKLLGN